MMDAAALSCRIEDRRKQLFDNPRWNGIDFVEVLPDQTALCVHFFGRVPDGIGVANVDIEGGRRIRDIRVVDVAIERAHDEDLDDCLRVVLDKPGDFSTYRLCLVEPVFATGTFVQVKQEGKTEPGGGKVSVTERSVLLESDFELEKGTSARAYLVRNAGRAREPEVKGTSSVDLGRVQPFKGPQRLAIPAGVNPKNFAAVVVWLENSESPPKSPLIAYYADLVLTALGPQEAENEIRSFPLFGLDPRYSCVEFSFKVDCPSDLDCKAAPECPPKVLPAPDINYLAKDYASFRQLILDRLALIMPDWQERHVPDLGITLVELLAYVGDYLSYYQDAVATEAYLDTARKRKSVRRHARLVDYRMHEGNNARAWVTVSTSGDLKLKAKECCFITGFADIKASSGRMVAEEDLRQEPNHSFEMFEPLANGPDDELDFRVAHNKIFFHTWGDRECCLPKGATRATLLDELCVPPNKQRPPAPTQARYDVAPRPPDQERPPRVLALKKGDVLILEEVKGPTTGQCADADLARRHAVRLSKDPIPAEDGLLNTNVLEIEWDPEDALPFSLCLSARLPAPDCRWIDGVSVARGNVVLVDHGRTCTSAEPLGPVGTNTTLQECACEGSVIEVTTVPERFTAKLQDGPLTFAEDCAPQASASRLIAQDPRQAKPRLSLQELGAATGPEWQPRYDLLESGGNDRHFVAEMDDDGYAHLRFGDGELGAQPASDTRFQATYRLGNGPAGNVGRDTITYMMLRSRTLSGVSVEPTNPLPARGGTAPEPLALVKLLAPSAFRTRRERAITAEDYAELAQRNAAIQRAAGELRWMGSWYEARVSVDPAHTEVADVNLLQQIRNYLYRYRRVGHDLAITPAQYVPLEIGIEVCVLPHYARGEIKAQLLDVFSNRQLADGSLGFFHPDRLTFGQGIYLSQIVAAATSVDGVETARVSLLRRPDGPDEGALASGVLPLGPFEIAECDNDPDFPEHGKLTLKMRGGR
jgi:Electron transfer DM13